VISLKSVFRTTTTTRSGPLHTASRGRVSIAAARLPYAAPASRNKTRATFVRGRCGRLRARAADGWCYINAHTTGMLLEACPTDDASKNGSTGVAKAPPRGPSSDTDQIGSGRIRAGWVSLRRFSLRAHRALI